MKGEGEGEGWARQEAAGKAVGTRWPAASGRTLHTPGPYGKGKGKGKAVL